MPSTYTLNNGITLIASGEGSGTWGDTTNVNLSLLDTALDGQVSITLSSAGSSGSPNDLPISDGSASNGRNRLVIFASGSDLGATAYVRLTPNDSEKIIYVRNALSGSRSIILFQGTYNASNDYELPAGSTAVIYFNGGGSGAVAANVFNNAYFDGLRLGSVSVTAILDEDNMSSNSATALSTQQSIKAYVDTKVATVDTLAEVLAIGNTSGGTNIVLSSGDAITTNTISETSSGSGVTVDSLLIKDGGITAAGTSTFAGQTISNLGSVTTADINGGTIDAVVIGGASAAAATVTSLTATGLTLGGTAVTSTAAELNILDGVTSTTAELNILDGVTSTTAELNILDGVTSTTAELNILDGVTSTASELNILDGATVVTSEINALDIGSTAIGTAVASKAVILDSNKDYTGVRNLTLTGALTLGTDLSVANGGTGASTHTANGILYGAGTGAVAATAVGTDGHVLTSNGSGSAPTFQAAAAGGATDIDGLSDGVTNSSGGTVGLGTDALDSDDGSANKNTALGFKAGEDTTTGAGNVFLGNQAGKDRTTGSFSVYIGEQAGALSTTGNSNTVIGYFANNGAASTGSDNTFMGKQAGYNITSGSNNSFFGVSAGKGATTATYTAALGVATFGGGALTGADNIGIGRNSGYNITSATNTIAIGTQAVGNGVTTGTDNTSIGNLAGYKLTSGTHNNFIGNRAGFNATTGDSNVAIGKEAISEGVLTGDNNVAIGYEAGHDLTSGGNNVTIGYRAGFELTTGLGNTLIGGFDAGGDVTTGQYNTILGYRAGDSLTTGSNNILIGKDAAASAVGVNNEITLGNGSISALRCQVQSISSLSDRRDKKDIEELPLGIDFINTLKPVKFAWDMRDGAKVGPQEAGFIAQDLDEAQINADAEDYLNLVLKNNPEKLEASYGKLVPVLVKAIQELSAEVKALKLCKCDT